MTDEQRIYMRARYNFTRFHIGPAKELLEATANRVNIATARAEETQKTLEELRPVWAQGFTSDSEAAQANGNALAGLWKLLGVDNQTAAVKKLEGRAEQLKSAFLDGHRWGRSDEPVTHSAGENWERSETRRKLGDRP